MSGKKKQKQSMVQIKNADGTTTMVSQGAFGLAQSLGTQINEGDMSSMDKMELMTGINDTIKDSHTQYYDSKTGKYEDKPIQGPLGMGGTPVESSMRGLGAIQNEIKDAIAGTKPKYRYRKYLDQVSALQQDQPGQLQTVLSRGGSGRVLGGGTM